MVRHVWRRVWDKLEATELCKNSKLRHTFKRTSVLIGTRIKKLVYHESGVPIYWKKTPMVGNCVYWAAKQTKEEEMLVDKTFQDLFRNKSFPQRYNKEQDLLFENDRLVANKENAELLRWHYWLNHMSFKKVKLLEVLGIVHKRLAKAKIPKCKGCVIGEIHTLPWFSYKQEI